MPLPYLGAMKYWITTPWWLRMLYPGKPQWHCNRSEKKLYLTFDDGPHPEITPWVLDALKEYDAKATFFCIGKNVQQYPEVFAHLLNEGHRVGNHTFHHLNGWKTDTAQYIEDVQQASRWIHSNLFRPPYGRISPFQAKLLQTSSTAYRIILWDVLSADFDTRLTGNQCFQYIQHAAQPGSIIVFHDSEKAFPRMKEALQNTLNYFASKGYAFDVIP